ncbi:polysaccharide deacetylase family protein [Alkaliphilus peptidifermentans]|uniref:Polysaccharide deacetylase n=1 Tax=Alkaliphilus peptidifermentans DSM 18978 TaxID=1120976 RepID=A0A1G5K4C0_9FIRM|nr:polysaccharide deacetylase family protein [Alkaliphilus peptidifermentans]SCY94878.1 Polysaccharide deacetylase [Alkaliphilus peptidifermentans DSM 18978]
MRKYMKLSIISVCIILLFFVFRANPISQASTDDGIPVLMYHHLLKASDITSKNPSIISVESFEAQMQILHDNDFYTPTLYELEQFLLGKIELPKNSVVITFDDGYLSNYVYAYPIMKSYGLRGSIFLITGLIEEYDQGFNPKTLQYLSRDNLISMLDVFEYANHTHNLHYIDNKKSYLLLKEDGELEEDIKTNMKVTLSPYFAYPYGQYNEDTIELLKSQGIRMAFTTKSGRVYLNDDLLRLKRIAVYPDTDINAFKKSVGIE